jgi:hypothetical protein
MRTFIAAAFVALALATVGTVSTSAAPFSGYPAWAQDAFTPND